MERDLLFRSRCCRLSKNLSEVATWSNKNHKTQFTMGDVALENMEFTAPRGIPHEGKRSDGISFKMSHTTHFIMAPK